MPRSNGLTVVCLPTGSVPMDFTTSIAITKDWAALTSKRATEHSKTLSTQALAFMIEQQQAQGPYIDIIRSTFSCACRRCLCPRARPQHLSGSWRVPSCSRRVSRRVLLGAPCSPP
eukprot:COSAG06_NODE_9654_length_1841_cov_1.319635_2_plen_116_part_00